MPTVVGTATIRIIPNTAGFTATLQSQLKGATTSINRSMGTTNQALGKTTKSVDGLTASLGKFGSQMIASGSLMTYAITRQLVRMGEAVVGTAAEFDESLKTIAAVAEIDIFNPDPAKAEAGIRQMESIGDLAIEMGRKGKFGALEMSEGFVEIARAGLQTEEQLSAIGNVVRKVATVESIDMKTAAEDLINVFAGLGGTFDETGASIFKTAEGMPILKEEIGGLTGEFSRLGDILAIVSARTTTNIVDLADAFRYAGPVASKAGIDIEQMAAALGVLAQSGFNATVGGTALRGIITRLAISTQQSQEIFEKFGLTNEQAFAQVFSPDETGAIAATEDQIVEMTETLRKAGLTTKEIDEVLNSLGEGGFVQNAEEMRKKAKGLGLELFDAAGNMKPLRDIIAEFANPSNKTGPARIGDIMKLMGQRSGPAFLALMKNAEAFDVLNDATRDAEGSLDSMSKKIESSATIQFARLKNSMIELAIRVGESGVLQIFTDAAQRVTEMVRSMADSRPEMFKWALAIAGVVGAMGPLRIVLGLSATFLKDFIKIGASLLAFNPFTIMAIGFGSLAAVIPSLVQQSEFMKGSFERLMETLRLATKPVIEFVKALANMGKGAINDLLFKFAMRLGEAFSDLNQKIDTFIRSDGLIRFFDTAYNAIKSLLDQKDLVFEFFTNLYEGAQNLFPLVEGSIKALIGLLPLVGDLLGVAAGAALLLSRAFKSITDFLQPVIDFLGDHMLPVLLLLLSGFIRTRVAAATFARDTGKHMGALQRSALAATGAVQGVGSAFRTIVDGSGEFAMSVQKFGTRLKRTFADMGKKLASAMTPFTNFAASLLRGFANIGVKGAGIFSRLGRVITNSLDKMLSGMNKIGPAINRMFIAPLGRAFELVLDKSGDAARALGRLTSFVSGKMVSTWRSLGGIIVHPIDAFRTSMNHAADLVQAFPGKVKKAFANFGGSVQNALRVLAVGIFDVGKRAEMTAEQLQAFRRKVSDMFQTIAGVGTQAIMGFVGGIQTMRSAASGDLEGTLTGLAVSITGIIQAAAAHPLLGAFVAAMTIVGQIIGKTKKQADELGRSIRENLLGAFDDGAVAAEEWIRITKDAADQIGGKTGQAPFVSLTRTLEGLGLSFGGMTDAIEGGQGSVDEFRRRFIELSILAETSDRFTFDRSTKGLIQVQDHLGNVVASGRTMTEVWNQMDGRISGNNKIAFDLFNTMVTGFNEAKTESEVLNSALDKNKDVQAILNQQARGFADAYDDAARSIDDAKSNLEKMVGLLTGAKGEGAVIDQLTVDTKRFIESIPGMSEAIENKAVPSISSMTNASAESRLALREFRAQFVTDLADLAAAAEGDPKKFDAAFAKLRAQITSELSQIGVPPEVADKFLADLTAFSEPFKEQIIAAGQEGFKGLADAKNTREIQNAIAGFGSTVRESLRSELSEAELFGKWFAGDLPGGLTADETKDISVAMGMELPKIPGVSPESVRAVFNALGQETSHKDIELLLKPLAKDPKKAKLLDALITGKLIDPVEVPIALEIINSNAANTLKGIAELVNFISGGGFGQGIPVFHKGGMVGESGPTTGANRGIGGNETLALLKYGEGVMTEEMVANMTRAQLHEFRSGNPRWWASGGPYEDGRSAGMAATASNPFGSSSSKYGNITGSMVRLLSAAFAGSAANIGSGAMGGIVGPVLDYAKGYAEAAAASQARFLASTGLPPGFDLSGSVPAGFDIPGWRSFLAANRGPGDFPLLISYLKAAGIPHLVNSTIRPGAITVSGRPSMHGFGRAVDFGAPNDANYDSPGLLRINRAFAPVMDVLRELIYSGPGGITNKSYGAKVMAGHHNHVHVALRNGGLVEDLVYAMLGENGPELVLPMNNPTRALSLARTSGLLNMLASAQAGQRYSTYNPSSVATNRRSAVSDGRASDGLLGGTGNTYHLHGHGVDQLARKIEMRDQATIRRRR